MITKQVAPNCYKAVETYLDRTYIGYSEFMAGAMISVYTQILSANAQQLLPNQCGSCGAFGGSHFRSCIWNVE